MTTFLINQNLENICQILLEIFIIKTIITICKEIHITTATLIIRGTFDNSNLNITQNQSQTPQYKNFIFPSQNKIIISFNHNYKQSSLNQYFILQQQYGSDNIDGGLSVIYEEEEPFYNHQNMMQTNFKKDEDDTLYGPYVSQNDTIEDLINSQSKGKTNKQQQYSNSGSNINNNFISSRPFYSGVEDGINNSISGSTKHQNRNSCAESYIGHVNNNENFIGNTKQRTSSVVTTDLHNSQKKLEYDYGYGYDGNHSSFNKIYQEN